MRDTPFNPADGDLVLRDDQAEFYAVLDEVRRRRARRARLRLIDGGVFSILEMERLGLAGADLFTSDKSGRKPADLFILNKAARKGGGFVAYFHHGPLGAEEAAAFPMNAVRDAARDGVALFLSNKTTARDAEDLIVLAEEAREGGNRLVYYHHGPLDPCLFDLARPGVWIHVGTSPGEESEMIPRLVDLAAATEAGGGGLIIHMKKSFSDAACEDLLAAGAHLLFRTPLSDDRSPLRPIEIKAARRRLDPRASYLFGEFMR